jgi:hypothetical protein
MVRCTVTSWQDTTIITGRQRISQMDSAWPDIIGLRNKNNNCYEVARTREEQLAEVQPVNTKSIH